VRLYKQRGANILLTGYSSLREYALRHEETSRLLLLLLESEVGRLSVWCKPTGEARKSGPTNAVATMQIVGSTRDAIRAYILTRVGRSAGPMG
jgi:hypothetical protein